MDQEGFLVESEGGGRCWTYMMAYVVNIIVGPSGEEYVMWDCREITFSVDWCTFSGNCRSIYLLTRSLTDILLKWPLKKKSQRIPCKSIQFSS